MIDTSQAPLDSSRPAGRIKADDIPVVPDSGLVYICGSERFAEAAGDLILQSGVAPDRLRAEKFGHSG